MSEQDTVIIPTRCPFCGTSNAVKVNRVDYLKWVEGMVCQNAMPSLSASDRELLITGICNDCFPSDPEDD